MNWCPLEVNKNEAKDETEEQSKFLMKAQFNSKTIELLLFDLTRIELFYLVQNEEEIMQLFNVGFLFFIWLAGAFILKLEFKKELNPSLEAPIGNIIDHLKQNLLLLKNNNPTSPSVFANQRTLYAISDPKNPNRLELKMKSKLSSVTFNWDFRFERLESSLIRDHFFIPLLFNCVEYQQRETELIKIIQAKDKELDDYKSQGVSLNRSNSFSKSFFIIVFIEKTFLIPRVFANQRV
jgi:hypothetical protein